MLRHSSDSEPGYTRKRKGRYWAYFDGEKRITDRDTIDRLNSIALPPAYTDAWFCKDPNGHLQATGIDDRGRKQYRYHPEFRARAEASKFAGLAEFGKALPRMRRKVDKDLRMRALSRDKVVAAVVRLLDDDYLRVGNEEYAKSNKSYGATTLLSRQVQDDGRKVRMRFKGKSGVQHEVTITDRTLRRIVRQLQELPGQALFQYVNGDGNPHPITSTEVNDYIREASGGDFTAKHFRTWGATVLAFEQMLDKADNARISVKTMIEPVAEALGNTVAMSRKAYVHPALIAAVKDNPRDPLKGLERPRARKWMSSCEVALIPFLKKVGKKARKAAAA
ncbi:MAG: topoisomerase [Sphingomonadales bacterium]|jgi:DNA topoisomerase-1|nr:topoisomerase [Sphingomonadales bacterium]